MHCGVMVTGYNQGDWERLLREDYTRPPTVSDAANMDDTLSMGELVEPLGFDSIWATEHYGSAYSMQPNPLQYLAYWAGRTTRVDMGTAVIVAPWWNPVRLAHEIAMLDILLKGRRLHLGIGRGIAPHEYASLGYPMAQSHKYFYDVVQILRAADGAERFTFDGEVYKIPPTTIRPQARHKGELTRNIKAAFSTPASMRLAAQHGLGQLFVASDDLDAMTAQVRQFNTIRAEHGLPPDQPTTQAPDRRCRGRRCGLCGPPCDAAHRHPGRDHRQDHHATAGDQPGNARGARVLRRDAPAQGRKEPPPLC